MGHARHFLGFNAWVPTVRESAAAAGGGAAAALEDVSMSDSLADACEPLTGGDKLTAAGVASSGDSSSSGGGARRSRLRLLA